MKIKMLTTEYHNNKLIWHENQTFIISKTNESYFRVTEIDGMWYCIDKKEKHKYEVIE